MNAVSVNADGMLISYTSFFQGSDTQSCYADPDMVNLTMADNILSLVLNANMSVYCAVDMPSINATINFNGTTNIKMLLQKTMMNVYTGT